MWQNTTQKESLREKRLRLKIELAELNRDIAMFQQFGIENDYEKNLFEKTIDIRNKIQKQYKALR